MSPNVVECLRCGKHHPLPHGTERLFAGECPRCGYLGWAAPLELTEAERRTMRERPPESRRLRLIAA
jgi:hypothetical protein